MLPKPSHVFDRDREWGALARFVADERPGPALAIVRGRRRHGKSILLRELCAATDGFYHQALEGTEADQIRDLASAIASFAGMPAPPSFADWSQALDALLGLPTHDAPLPVVLDEFGYLVASSPQLPSSLQRILDVGGSEGARARVILCGSAISIMSSLLVGRAPLRGRASTEIVVRPLSHRDAATFIGLEDDPLAALCVQAVCGGVPGYYVDMLAGDVPADHDDVDDWMVRGPLNVTRPLLHEARHLMSDEPGVRDHAMYLSTLGAIASGATRSSEIAQRLNRSPSAVAHPLQVLTDLGLVVRREDVLRPTRPTWHIADPLLRFYTAVMRPDWPRLEGGRANEVWRDAQPRWRSQVLGPHLEELGRVWAGEHAQELARTDDPVHVGPTVVHDPERRTGHEVDIAGVETSSGQVRFLGEVTLSRVGNADVGRLERLRDLLCERGIATPQTRLLFVSAEGMDVDASTGVVPVDLERLYEG